MAQYLNINVRVPLPDNALTSAQIQTTALTCAQAFRDDISAKLKGFAEIDMTAGVVRVKGPKTKTAQNISDPVPTETPVTVAAPGLDTLFSPPKPAERELPTAAEPTQQRAPTPPWAQG